MDDQSANVNTVTNAVQSKWEYDYIIITGDGLEVDDSSGTQGNVSIPYRFVWLVMSYNFHSFTTITDKFQHVPTQTFYAITHPDHECNSKKCSS